MSTLEENIKEDSKLPKVEDVFRHEGREYDFRVLTCEGRLLYNIGSLEFFTDGSIIANGEIPVKRLLQFTGLLDKNKQKIREGDIIKFRGEQEYGVIEFVEGRFSYNLIWRAGTATSRDMYLQERIDDKTGNLEREVIGNVFENSSLLQ